MSPWVVQCEGIGKRYRVKRRNRLGVEYADAEAGAAPFGTDRGSDDWFWALKDASFTLNQGEILGLIGANGAGKSTLLKILARLTEPTTGCATIRGRLGSLLEVGTGFQMEMSGRENIFLSGAMLGMREDEIRKCLDAIVDFSGIEQFIDTPVKHYSSGMYMRLAFSVAAHLRTEVLLVDEVLAVGDATFQRKCLRTMDRLARDGRTLIFVSHSTDAVRRLCSHALLLEHGRVVDQGATSSVVDGYMTKVNLQLQTTIPATAEREGLGQVRFLRTWVEDERRPTTSLTFGRLGKIVATFSTTAAAPRELLFGASVYAANGQWLTDLSNYFWEAESFAHLPRQGRVEFIVPNAHFRPGRYRYNLIVRSARVGQDMQDWLTGVGAFEVAGARGDPQGAAGYVWSEYNACVSAEE